MTRPHFDLLNVVCSILLQDFSSMGCKNPLIKLNKEYMRPSIIDFNVEQVTLRAEASTAISHF